LYKFVSNSKLSFKGTLKIMAAVGKYQLIYFPTRGRGQAIRYLFQDNGIDFEEIHCHENWQTKWKLEMAFGQSPCLKDNKLNLVQSNAILRHLARKHGLYGSSENEAAYIDMIIDGVEDIRGKYAAMIYRNYENGKEAYIADLPGKLEPFEKLMIKLGNSKNGFCVGQKKSVADYCLFDILDVHLVLAPKCLDTFPQLQAFNQAVQARAGVAAYRQSDKHKNMPINGNGKQ